MALDEAHGGERRLVGELVIQLDVVESLSGAWSLQTGPGVVHAHDSDPRKKGILWASAEAIEEAHDFDSVRGDAAELGKPIWHACRAQILWSSAASIHVPSTRPASRK